MRSECTPDQTPVGWSVEGLGSRSIQYQIRGQGRWAEGVPLKDTEVVVAS